MLIFTDIHGCKNTFDALLKKVRREYPNDPMVVAGDVMDRGPNSKGLIEYLIQNNIDYVLGNHDRMMMDYRGRYRDDWGHNGGLKTLKEYGNDVDSQAFIDHKFWLKEQPYIREYPQLVNAQGRYLIVTHSGITHPAIPAILHVGAGSQDYLNATQEIIWNRSTPIDTGYAFNVFGHTPTPEPIITDYYANIDTGCCYWKPEPPLILGGPKKPRLGKLTCFQFPDMRLFQQENVDWAMRPEYNEATL